MFIVFEGLDGCGKTTQIKLLEKKLKDLGYDNVKIMREPGSTELSESIREILLNQELSDIQRLFLFLTARNSITREQIIPSIENGDIVLCDRYAPSTLAYQGYGKKICDIGIIHRINNLACENVHPDLIIFIDTPIDECMKRQNTHDKMEESSLNVYKDIYEGYKQLSKNNNWFTVDGTKTEEEISEEILNIVKNRM